MKSPIYILGVSAYYHDSAAALLCDGDIIAAAQEERFTRKKHDNVFPIQSVKYVLSEAGIQLSDLSWVVYYEKPFIKFERLLETYHAFAPSGLRSFLLAIPVWIKEKLFLKRMIRTALSELGGEIPPFLFPDHHLSHQASAFFPSPFEEAAILTLDGVGEWATTTIAQGKGNSITLLKELNFPHSLGLLYSAFTYYCGFRVNSGEYKLMGLAPYGDSDSSQTALFKSKILTHLVDIRDDGSFVLNLEYFNFTTGLTMTHDRKWENLFGFSRRHSEGELTQDLMNLALAIQQVCEEIVLRLAETARSLTGCRHLVMAGGVALNCVANGKLLREKTFEKVWIQPAAGDAGGALGAALAAWYIHENKERVCVDRGGNDFMKGSLLGPTFSAKEVRSMLRFCGAPATYFDDEQLLLDRVSSYLDDGKVVGWFQGAMEFGPRALGNRSILADPRQPDMQKKLNLKIKYREGFRPFAPIVLADRANEFFDIELDSPYMLIVAPLAKSRRRAVPENFSSLEMYDRLYFCRSDIPAVTHVDYSARIQSVDDTRNERLSSLLRTFGKKTDCPVLINTSFNVRGEPIVCTPMDAYRCFMRTEMDVLCLGDFVLLKSEQPIFEDGDWQEEFALD